MTSPRALRDDITNAFDFLLEAGLVMYATSVAMRHTRVTWHALSQTPFFIEESPATPEQYLRWVTSGHYSAAIPDGSLLQLTYDVRDGEVVGHRLAYVPCPVIVDEELLREGEPIADVVRLYLDEASGSAVALRSPIRFDFDPASVGEGHPAAHLTLNDQHCRIACVAPMHPYRFIDFVYRHFYPAMWTAQRPWFRAAAGRMLGERVLTDEDRGFPHVMWELHPGLRH